MKREVILRGEGLSVGYKLGKGETKVVHGDLSFNLYRGELTSLLGPNGAGKSTLLRTLSGTQTSLGGDLFFRDQAIDDLTKKQLSKEIAIVLTDKTFAGGLRVEELVAVGRYPHTGFFGKLSHHDKVIIEQSMKLVGITSKRASYVAELSDGERQKVMIAKALAQQSPLILLDEPTAFLDVVSRIEIMTLLHRIARNEGKTILLSTHDMQQALQLSDRLWLLSRSEGMLSGATEDLVLGDQINRFFRGREVTFDKQTGNFASSTEKMFPIHVKASNETLLFWANNALTRNGFVATDKKSNAYLSIEVISEENITIFEKGSYHTCGSFDSMIATLTKNK